jgi:hypothetical protein
MKLFRVFLLSTLSITLVQADPTGFTVTKAFGQADLGPDLQNLTSAKKGQAGPLGWWARTGENSYLTISFNEGNKFRLLDASEAQVSGEDLSNGSWHRVISLKIGCAEITHESTLAQTVKLDCETPSSHCGAEGTVFKVDATKGIFTVDRGKIGVSSALEPALSLTAVTSGGTLTYTPGAKTTWCDWARAGGAGPFSGTVTIGALPLKAVGADFTIAKELADPNKTVINIKAGTVGGFAKGIYLVKGGPLVLVPPALIDTAKKYITASKKESALYGQYLAFKAAGLPPAPPDLKAQADTAAADTRSLAAGLFK